MAWRTDMTPRENLPDLPDDSALVPEHGKGRGDPTWIAPALTTSEKTRHVGKTNVFFGPPLAILADGQKNTLAEFGSISQT